MVTSAGVKNNPEDAGAQSGERPATPAVSAPAAPSSRRESRKPQARDTERPLVEDIRLLGQLLGDVIREQEGVAAYELIEQVRKLSVAFRRDADPEADNTARHSHFNQRHHSGFAQHRVSTQLLFNS